MPPTSAPESPPLPAYADWKAPRTDGAVLLWPEGQTLLALPAANAALLANSPTTIHGVPLPELRSRVRQYLGHTGPAPIIMTGHQTELHHAGVWVKNVVIHFLAERVAGRAMHLAVDTDSPKHLVLKYPIREGNDVSAVELPITDDEHASTAEWSGRVSGPTALYAADLERRFAAESAGFGFDSGAGEFLHSLRRASMEEGVLPNMLVAALHEFDWNLGLRYDALLASPLWDSEGFLLLCCHLLAHAPNYAAHYNRALAEYRAAEGIDNPGRPMPDLKTADNQIELPLWLDNHATGHRTRPFATLRNSTWSLQIGPETFDATPDAGWDAATALQRLLRRLNYRLSPRALTLTTFARLCIADLFVHGIGGGRYDQVTDRTLVSFFHLPRPPAFAVATGTLYFPWAGQPGRQRACLPCVKTQGHRLKHAALGDRKMSLVHTIATLPRRSLDRKRIFLDMQAQLHKLWLTSPDLKAWEQNLAATERAALEDEIVFDRELFYALQPRQRLQDWIKQVEQQIVPSA